ncbi:hypothetical protein R1sor_020292 [Riccia sorocarpa]|uniref:Transposase n=1 Tax=Riccia sorocarpa TaxID=122646 RepID=A0ABD3IEX1_9MARC
MWEHFILHGRFHVTRIWHNKRDWDSSDEEWYEDSQDENREGRQDRMTTVTYDQHQQGDFDGSFDVNRMITEIFTQIDEVNAEILDVEEESSSPHADYNDEPFELGVQQSDNSQEQLPVGLDDIGVFEDVGTLKAACAPLYEDAKISQIAFVMMLLNIFSAHGCPNVVVDEILKFLHKVVMPEDSKQWKHIDATWPNFARETRNMRFGLALDGINPFSVQSSIWSSWPIILLNYNLPPWTEYFRERMLRLFRKYYIRQFIGDIGDTFPQATLGGLVDMLIYLMERWKDVHLHQDFQVQAFNKQPN